MRTRCHCSRAEDLLKLAQRSGNFIATVEDNYTGGLDAEIATLLASSGAGVRFKHLYCTQIPKSGREPKMYWHTSAWTRRQSSPQSGEWLLPLSNSSRYNRLSHLPQGKLMNLLSRTAVAFLLIMSLTVPATMAQDAPATRPAPPPPARRTRTFPRSGSSAIPPSTTAAI